MNEMLSGEFPQPTLPDPADMPTVDDLVDAVRQAEAAEPMMPIIIDQARTSRFFLGFYRHGEEDQIHFAHVDRVRRALKNTRLGESDTASFYGVAVTESDCKSMLSAMGVDEK